MLWRSCSAVALRRLASVTLAWMVETPDVIWGMPELYRPRSRPQATSTVPLSPLNALPSIRTS